jgi:hypothetical protein
VLLKENFLEVHRPDLDRSLSPWSKALPPVFFSTENVCIRVENTICCDISYINNMSLMNASKPHSRWFKGLLWENKIMHLY